MFVLAHLSDPHLPMPPPRLGELAGKRLLGFLNWQRRRRFEHRREILDGIVRDLDGATPDHVAVTGDLVNIALPGEFAPALALLATLGPPERVTFVPGNHDAYVRAAMQHSLRSWGAYMRGDGATAPLPLAGRGRGWGSLSGTLELPPSPPLPHKGEGSESPCPPDEVLAQPAPETGFPFLRRRWPLALIGLSTAIPTAPFMATGALGASQLTRLAEHLTRLAQQRAFRVVLLHHPPLPFPGDRLKRLRDAAAFRAVLAEHGAELVLHGHSHVHSLAWLDGPAGRIPVVGVPSASSAIGHDDDPAAYNLYRIEDGTDGWGCEMISRGLSPAHDGVVELGRRILHG